jgi:hypothetical protein
MGRVHTRVAARLAAIVVAATLISILSPGARSLASTAPVDVFPVPGDRVAAPTSQITFRGIPAGQLGSISVTGSSSGSHAGRILPDSDGRGGSFMPTTAFKPGEKVTVRTSLNIVGGSRGSFSFTTAAPAGRIRAGAVRGVKRVRGDVWRFASRPDLAPAAVRLTRRPSRAEAGDVFVASQTGPSQNGPEILGPYAGLVYYQPVPRGQSATDFRVQSYRGRKVLTWWQGIVNAAGVGQGQDEIYDSHYRPVATVKAGNGLNSDLHEFQITSQNTALVTAYHPVYWNASSVKGASKHEIVLDCVVQEIDIPTGLVLYQWDSLDHVPVGDSYQPPPKAAGFPWDYFHLNSIQPQADGDLVISSRDTWAAYEISHRTGSVIWTLNGKHSSFKMGKGAAFAFQHDARTRANGQITIFDDGAGPPVVHKQSRGITLRLDMRRKTATLLGQDEHNPALGAAYEGNVQRLANGDDMIGWGQQPYFTEFNSRGHEVFDARFVGATDSYRAYRFAWNGTPATPPAATVRDKHGRRTVWASWNGSTSTVRWRVLAGASPTSLKPVASGPRTAFESGIRLPHAYHDVSVQALGSHGQVLGTSKPIKG